MWAFYVSNRAKYLALYGGHMCHLGPRGQVTFGPLRSNTVKLDLKRKETRTKTVAIATSNKNHLMYLMWLNIHAKYPFPFLILSKEIRQRKWYKYE